MSDVMPLSFYYFHHQKARFAEEKMGATAVATLSAVLGVQGGFREDTQIGFGPHLHSLHFPLRGE